MGGLDRRLIGLVLLCTGTASAAADPICAARPGKSTPSCTVPAGQWQTETGLADWSLQNSGGERDTALVIGETSLRIGLTDSSEVAVDVTPWQRSGGARGIGDLLVMYKQRLTPAAAALQVSVLPVVKIPTAKRALGNGQVEAALLVPVGYAIGKSPFSLGLTPQLGWAADADGRGHHAAMVQVASLSWQASATLSLSGELWGQWDWDPAGTTRQASADAAAAYLVSNDVQLDAGANFGLNRVTPDVELYAGVSKRF